MQQVRKLSWKQFLLVMLGGSVFGLALVMRDELSGIALRALVAALGTSALAITMLLAFRPPARR